MRGEWRRTKCAGVVVAGALTLTATLGTGQSAALPQTTSAPAQTTPFNKGTGTAFAESIRVDPVAGGLSFGIGIGQALAGHQNTVASADSRAINLGVIGVTLGAEGCDGGDPTLPADQQPQPVTARTGDEGAEAGKSGTESFAGGQITKFARANADPFAEAITTSAPIDIPGIISISGTRAASHSGVINGNEREAGATVDIGSISFAGGAVGIGGIHTEVLHRSGGENDVATGSFSIGSATVAGVPLPLSSDPIQQIEQLNAVLLPLGFQLQAPSYHPAETSAGTIAVMDPLQIAIVPSTLRDGVTGPLLSAAQPAREALFAALLEQDCGNSTYITVLDIVLNAIGAGGRLSLDLGGASATTGAINQFQFGDRPTVPTPGGTPTVTPPAGSGSGTSSSSGGTTPRPPSTTPSVVTPGVTQSTTPRTEGPLTAAPIAQTITGERGGLMALVAGAGLLLMLASAEGDRRKMRRAQRELPFEA